MSIIQDILDGIKLASDTVDSIKSLHEAIKSGKNYVTAAHPKIKADVADMFEEMRKTCNAVADASRLITHFRFNSSPGVIDSEPTRFNNEFLVYIDNENLAKEHIYKLKGHCDIIKNRIDKLSGKANVFRSIFGLSSNAQETAIRQSLQNIYDGEMEYKFLVGALSESINASLKLVQEAMTENGMLTSKLIPQAAQTLAEISKPFLDLQTKAAATRDAIGDTIAELTT